MKLSDQQFEFAKDCVLLEQWMINHGYKFTYGEAWRPDEMQKTYFKKGYPARSTVVADLMHEDFLVEVEAIAWAPGGAD